MSEHAKAALYEVKFVEPGDIPEGYSIVTGQDAMRYHAMLTMRVLEIQQHLAKAEEECCSEKRVVCVRRRIE